MGVVLKSSLCRSLRHSLRRPANSAKIRDRNAKQKEWLYRGVTNGSFHRLSNVKWLTIRAPNLAWYNLVRKFTIWLEATWYVPWANFSKSVMVMWKVWTPRTSLTEWIVCNWSVTTAHSIPTSQIMMRRKRLRCCYSRALWSRRCSVTSRRRNGWRHRYNCMLSAVITTSVSFSKELQAPHSQLSRTGRSTWRLHNGQVCCTSRAVKIKRSAKWNISFMRRMD